MFRYYLRSRWRDYIGWGCLLLLLIFWSLLDGGAAKPIRIYTEEDLIKFNISYSTTFVSVEEAVQAMPALMVDRLFTYVLPNLSGHYLLFPLFSSLLLARLLGNPSVQLPLQYGYSRQAHVLLLSVTFYLTMYLLLGLRLLLMFFRMGRSCFAVVDWPQLLHAYVFLAIFLCGFTSISTFFAFATQSMWSTFLLSLAYLVVVMVIHLWWTQLGTVIPLYYLLSIDFVPPYDTASLHTGTLVSVLWIVISAVASCVVYNHRDIRVE